MKKLVYCLVLLLYPSGVSAGLIVNGNFSSGNTGFTTAYTYSPGDIGPAQSYDVVDNPAHSRPHDISPVSYGDHTTGTGLMMAVNGAAVPNVVFWSETISITANTDYNFSFWISSWFPASPATVDVQFNGLSVGTAFAPSTVAVWQQFQTTWNSGANTSLTINLIDSLADPDGNDFAVDDIDLTGPTPNAVPEPASILLALTGAGLIGCGWRRGMGERKLTKKITRR